MLLAWCRQDLPELGGERSCWSAQLCIWPSCFLRCVFGASVLTWPMRLCLFHWPCLLTPHFLLFSATSAGRAANLENIDDGIKILPGLQLPVLSSALAKLSLDYCSLDRFRIPEADLAPLCSLSQCSKVLGQCSVTSMVLKCLQQTWGSPCVVLDGLHQPQVHQESRFNSIPRPSP